MIGKVMRGSDVGGLLRYLYGPGRSNEHVDPHLVGTWDEAAQDHEPAWVNGAKQRDVRPLAGLLEQPVAAAASKPAKPVWHCALRVAPGDRRLTDQEWREVARAVMQRTGLARVGDDGRCRWVAVRHADDHIHLVVTLARQDGARASISNDYYRLGEACRWAEQRFGLTGTPARDRTASKRPTRAESEKATRTGRSEPPRAQLRRQVRTALAGASNQTDFLERLNAAGVLVRPRFSERTPGEVTGYAVALPGDRDAKGQPVWFGGGKLAADLSWTKVSRRWGSKASDADDGQRPKSHGSVTERAAAWERARRAAVAGAVEVRRLSTTDPGAAADVAHATADMLAVTARVAEGRRGGPLTEASDAYERASRELWGRQPRPSAPGSGLRTAARLLAMTGRAARDETTQLWQLLTALTALADAVAVLRDTQSRAAQAAAARDAAQRLCAVAPARPERHAHSNEVRRPVRRISDQQPRERTRR